MAEQNITRRLNIFINGKQVERTLTNLRKEYVKAKAQLNRAPIGSKQWEDAAKRVNRLGKELDFARKEQKDFLDTVRSTNQTLEKGEKGLSVYVDGLRNIKNGISSGDLLQVEDGFKGLAGGIRGATRAAIGFIATPIGAAITAIAGIALGARQWANYNNKILRSIVLTEQLTGLTGEAADQTRTRAQALANTFDSTNFEENLRTAKVLVENFKISYQEAFDVIEDGLVKGQEQNKEYFESLREYPVFFAQAGFSAKQFKDIIEAGFDVGIFNDKLVDAIKEFDISIREQTTSTRAALINAFGEPFSTELLARVRNGELTTKQALEAVAEEAKKQGIDIQENAQLTADLFRGAGEDAGGAIKIFEALGVAVDNATRELSPMEEVIDRISDANRRLEEAQDAALKSNNYIAFTNSLDLFWKEVKILFFQGIEFITDSFSKVQDFIFANMTGIIATAKSFPTIMKQGVVDVRNAVVDTVLSFGKLGEVVQNILNFDFTAARQSASEFREGFVSALSDIGSSAKTTFDRVIETQQAVANAAQQKLEEVRQAEAELFERQNQQNANQGAENPNQDPVENFRATSEKVANIATVTAQTIKNLSDDAVKQLAEEAKKRDKILTDGLNREKSKRENAAKAQILAEKQKSQAIIGAATNTLGAVSSLLGQETAAGKAAAVTEATINTYLGASQVVKDKTIPTFLKPFAVASIIALGLKQVSQINRTRVPSFNRGGETGVGDRGLGKNQGGFVRGTVEEGEYVVPRFVRKDPEVPYIINYLEKKRTGQTTQGSSTLVATQNNDLALQVQMETLQILKELRDNGIDSRAVIGDDNLRDMEERNNTIKQARENAIVA